MHTWRICTSQANRLWDKDRSGPTLSDFVRRPYSCCRNSGTRKRTHEEDISPVRSNSYEIADSADCDCSSANFVHLAAAYGTRQNSVFEEKLYVIDARGLSEKCRW